MNYKKIHNKIINDAKQQFREKNTSLYENHHIIPKCFNGNDDKNNLVFLTFREHYIIHKLLTLIYPKERKVWYTLWLMSSIKKTKEKYGVSSRDYEYARKRFRENGMSEETKQKLREALKDNQNGKGYIHSIEERKKQREGQKGIQNWSKGLTKETDPRIKSHKGWNKGLTKDTDTRIKKQSINQKGRIPWNKGKTGVYTEEMKRKMVEGRNYKNKK